MSDIYNWKRYWYPSGFELKLPFEGFLPDPEDEFQKLFNNRIYTLDELNTEHCLFLLGELGIGKSREFINQSKITDNHDNTNIIKISEDLKSYDLINTRISDIFNSDKFIDWLNSSKTLYLYFDSIDECMIQTDNFTIPAQIASELNKYKARIENIYIRIFCRANYWSKKYEDEFRKLYSDSDDVDTFILAPLRKKDIQEILNKKKIEESVFFQKAVELDAIPFLIKPITLFFLINYYEKTLEFPKSKYELYEKGCEYLCSEESLERSKYKISTPKQRLITASRIAALTILTNRVIINRKELDINFLENEVSIQELIGGSDTLANITIDLNNKNIFDEAIDTGLFSHLTQEKIMWDNKSYAEFLAAWYLTKKGVKKQQILSLITRSYEETVTLIPQLKETTAWLASINNEIFDEIIKLSPEILIKSDVLSLTDSQKKKIIITLLKRLDENTILTSSLGDFRYLRNLNYQYIENDIEPYILNKNKSIDARIFSLHLIETCKIKSSKEKLLGLIRDENESYDIRVEAIDALFEIIDNEFKKDVFKEFTDSSFYDPEDRIKAIVLNALWPSIITTKELFAAITPPKAIHSTYHIFLTYQLPLNLRVEDLSEALDWVDHLFPRIHSFDALSQLISSIITKTINNLQDRSLIKKFAKLFIKMSDNYYWGYDNQNTILLRTTLLNNNAIKQKIVIEIVHNIDIEKNSESVHYLAWDLLFEEDLKWLIRFLKDEQEINNQLKWSHIIWEKFRFSDRPKWIELLYNNMNLNEFLKEKIYNYLKPVMIESTEAIREKELYNRVNSSLRNKKDPNSYKENLSLILINNNSLDINTWLNIHHLVIWHKGFYIQDIINSPGWKEIDVKQQSQIVALAIDFLRYYLPNKQESPNNEEFLACINAIRLAFRHRLNEFIDIIKKHFSEWSYIILIDPFINDNNFNNEIVRTLYKYNKQVIVDMLFKVIDEEIKGVNLIYVINKFDSCWDSNISDLIFNKLQKTDLDDKVWESMLAKLLSFHNIKVKEFSIHLINQVLEKTTKEREKALIAGKLLIKNPTNDIWQVIWKVLTSDYKFGKDLIERANDHDICIDFLKCIDEPALMYLYFWLVRNYPYIENEYQLDHARRFRDTVQNELKDRGTFKSCKAIKLIIAVMPELSFLKKNLLAAQESRYRKSWIPPKPYEVLTLCLDSNKRFVKDGNDLINTVMESLSKIEIELQGVTPTGKFLWDEKKKNNWRPKNEEVLSDYIKIFLHKDINERGIILNREVEIRKRTGGKPGEITDIHVDAFTQKTETSTLDPIKLIIEVKGCWNKNVLKDIEDQLVNRYLTDNDCKLGIYIVGWYDCIQWDEKDYKKATFNNLQMNKDQLQEKLKELSKKLSEQQNIVINSIVINTALR